MPPASKEPCDTERLEAAAASLSQAAKAERSAAEWLNRALERAEQLESSSEARGVPSRRVTRLVHTDGAAAQDYGTDDGQQPLDEATVERGARLAHAPLPALTTANAYRAARAAARRGDQLAATASNADMAARATALDIAALVSRADELAGGDATGDAEVPMATRRVFATATPSERRLAEREAAMMLADSLQAMRRRSRKRSAADVDVPFLR